MKENEVKLTIESLPGKALLHIQEMTVTCEMKRAGLGGDCYDGDTFRGYLRVSPEGLKPIEVDDSVETAFSVLATLLGNRVRIALVDHVDALYSGIEHSKKVAVMRHGGTSSRIDAGPSRKEANKNESSFGSEVF